MDEMIYVAMSGAAQAMDAMATVSHNLANVSTSGFRADLNAFRSLPVEGEADTTRIYAVAEQPGFDLSPGAIQATGRPLDIAVVGPGWISVMAPDGSDALTKAGDLRIDEAGLLINGAGHPVLGESGPIAVPNAERVDIAADGTVSAQFDGGGQVAVIDRIRLVNPDVAGLFKGSDGLVRTDGGVPEADAAVRVQVGAVESSNVNAVEALVNMITLSRQYEAQIKLMQAAEENDETATTILRMS